MDERTLLTAIDELTRQKSPDGIHEVLQRYPGLVSESTFLALRKLATQASSQGNTETSRFFDEMATWLQGLSAEIALANNPISQLAQQLLAGAISLDDALVRLRMPTVIRQYSDDVLSTLDDVAWSLRDAGQHQPALLVARLNFEAARNTDSGELRKYSGITLLQMMPTMTEFAELRALVCEVTEQWLDSANDAELWAGLMVEHGNALVELATGNKAENVERGIECYQNALQIRTQAALPHQWATTMLNLGSAYTNRERGDRQENFEFAIDCYQQALQILNRETTPNEWATVVNALGAAYSNRISGSNADNIEQAIQHLDACVQVHTFESFPAQWATAQNNLGVAYGKRVRGEAAENKEQSIQHHENALRVLTANNFPVEWARTNYNLGIAFSDRLRGERSQNIERAIAYFESALQVRTHESFPFEWAMTMAHLGRAYDQDRSKVENLEKAIGCYKAALENLNPDSYPHEWATFMTALGNAQTKRASGESTENIERAIEYFEECLELTSREKSPLQWAEVNTHLGVALFKRKSGEKVENLERAIDCLQSALTVLTRDDFPGKWATALLNLGNVYGERIRGERSENLESAISCFESALQVRSREAFPDEWAIIMDNLASAYRDRVAGDRAANCEQAIKCLEAALQVRNREAVPRDWAITTDHLALAYLRRVRGRKANNVEEAIRLIQASLDVIIRAEFPSDWALIMSNLGSAYVERIYGNKADNIERAIECCQAALQVFDRKTSALDWALTVSTLAAIYGDRLVGKRSENLELAIEYSQTAMQVFTRETFPQQWGTLVYNLGNIYRNRIRGDFAENLERAIECYDAALQVRTAETLPELWARTMHSLGVAYYHRLHGKRSENIELAIECCRSTLSVRTREAFPREWARATHDLGLAFSDREHGDKANDIEQAIKLMEDAATVHTRDDFPFEWSLEMHGLADSYAKRVFGDREDNLDRAIEYYETSLKVITREAFPQQWALTMLRLGIAVRNRSSDKGLSHKIKAMEYFRLAAEAHLELGLPDETNRSFSALGDLAFEMQQYNDALNAYSQALEQVESIRAETLSLKRRAVILQTNTRLFDRSIIALMKLNRPLEALELAERGKSRTLTDLLTLRDLRPKNTPPEILDSYEQMLFRIRSLEDLLQAAGDQTSEEEPLAETAAQRQQRLEQIRRELLETQNQLKELVDIIHQHDKDFLPHAKSLTVDDIKHLASEANATLILFRVTEGGSFVFLVFPDGQTDVVQVSKFTTDHLNQLLMRSDSDGTTHGWALQYYVYKSVVTKKEIDLVPLAFQVWLETMDGMLGDVYAQLMKSVHQSLKNKLGEGVSSIVLIPNRGLSILPLHASWWNEDGNRRYLLDKFVVSYAPSLSVYRRCLERERGGRQKDELLAIANPVPPGNLTFSELECAEIECLLGKDRCLILSGKDATKDAVLHYARERHWLHFSCHGQYKLDAPFDSSLFLANNESLSLAEILEQLDLRHTWLTILSACETGLVDFREISDEHYGLPIGFLFAGTPTVWGTLWIVNDSTTALLMIKAYECLIKENSTKAKAIREAQLWLRDMNAADLELLIQEKQTRSAHDAIIWTVSARLKDGLENGTGPAERPFAHPFYWAGMQSIGA